MKHRDDSKGDPMAYPRKPYLSFHSCGFRIMPEAEGSHAESPHGETVPCETADPERPAPKRVSRFNWTQEANPCNPALLSPIEGYRERRRKGRRRAIGAFAVLAVLLACGTGAIALGIAHSDNGSLSETNVFSTALPLLPTAETAETGFGTKSTPVQDWVRGTVPKLYQNDPQWAAAPYASSTLGACGQAPLCMTMAHVALTGSQDVLPPDVASVIETSKLARDASTEASLIPVAAEALGLKANEVALNESSIRRQIVKGNPIVCAMGPGDFAEKQSFVVLADIGMDSKLEVHDPASDKRSCGGWSFDKVISQAEAMWAISASAEGAA